MKFVHSFQMMLVKLMFLALGASFIAEDEKKTRRRIRDVIQETALWFSKTMIREKKIQKTTLWCPPTIRLEQPCWPSSPGFYVVSSATRARGQSMLNRHDLIT